MRAFFLLGLNCVAATIAVAACSSSSEEPVSDAGPDVSAPDATDTATPAVDADVDAAVIVYTNGFESDAGACEGWTAVGGTAFTTEAIAASGSRSCRVCMPPSSSSVYIDIVVPADKVGPYIFNAQVRNESTSAFALISFTDISDAGPDAALDASPDFGTFRTAAALGNTFAPLTITATPTQAPKRVRLRFGAEKEGGLACIDVDDVALTFHP